MVPWKFSDQFAGDKSAYKWKQCQKCCGLQCIKGIDFQVVFVERRQPGIETLLNENDEKKHSQKNNIPDIDHIFDENGAIDQYAFLKPNEDFFGNIFAFETGYGEGFYASYIGFGKSSQPIKIVAEFIEIFSW